MGLILSILLNTPVAVAQEDGAIAKQLYLNGKMLFEEKRYEEAVTAWSKAYELSEKPVVLYNIAIAYEKLEDYQKSIDTLYQYRIYAPQEEQEELLLKIEGLKKTLANYEKIAAEQNDDSYKIEKVQNTDNEIAKKPSSETTIESESTPELSVSPPAAMSPNPIPMYTALGTGIVSLGTGVVLGVLANQSNELAEYAGGCGLTNKGILVCTQNSEGEAYFWEANQRALWADISYGVSVLSFGTAAWLTYRSSQDSNEQVTSSVWFTPNGVGLQGRF